MLVRDLLPKERISAARLRDLIATIEPAALNDWSCRGAGAIRPRRLAELIRERLWAAHDVTLTAVRKQVAGKGGEACYRVVIEIDTDAGLLTVESRTRFSATQSGRIAAEIALKDGCEWRSLTASPVVLQQREATLPRAADRPA